MVRPRTGDFLYSDEEITVMMEEIRIFKKAGVRGVVVGVLDKAGRVDVERMRGIVDEALPVEEVCFHRAFDMTRDPDEALRDIENIGGVSRILTSGHGKSVPEALPTIASLIRTTKEGGITILPGSGIDMKTVGTVLDTLLPLGLREIHLSGGKWKEGAMEFRREGMGMGTGGKGEWGVWMTDEEIMHEVRVIVDGRWALANKLGLGEGVDLERPVDG
ncbi:hypothetical protein H0H81_003724 [Sphagnurus paluster]|uniref:Copper homeostasis protein cutC homolog n=1 Tax=Sphagnurus paluster TaxID=117069 RepID=A0A9P7FZF4_9AGAR|nr:hypothetical protein H0H81_003724 [Sphagnurus paluster]